MKYLLTVIAFLILFSICLGQVSPSTFPVKGVLTDTQIENFYPDILDTISDKRIIASDPVELNNGHTTFYVSILHNAGTFDQMFLCTHDTSFNLIETYYIGKARMFDKTSHTIDFNIVENSTLHFKHVDYGYLEQNGKFEIDTLKHWEYFLSFDEDGRIIKK